MKCMDSDKVCEHERVRTRCEHCSPDGYLEYRVLDMVSKVLVQMNVALDSADDIWNKFMCTTLEDYKEYLEKLMRPDMNFGNLGKVWRIEFMARPMDLYTRNIRDIIRRLHYTNTRPERIVNYRF